MDNRIEFNVEKASFSINAVPVDNSTIVETLSEDLDRLTSPVFRCVHCAALPAGRIHEHTVIGLLDDTSLERVWFNVKSITAIVKHHDVLVPDDGAIGDWRYQAQEYRGVVCETLTLSYEGQQWVWKLTDEYRSDMMGSFVTGYSEQRLGIWAD